MCVCVEPMCVQWYEKKSLEPISFYKSIVSFYAVHDLKTTTKKKKRKSEKRRDEANIKFLG